MSAKPQQLALLLGCGLCLHGAPLQPGHGHNKCMPAQLTSQMNGANMLQLASAQPQALPNAWLALPSPQNSALVRLLGSWLRKLPSLKRPQCR